MKEGLPPQIPASCTCKWCCKWVVCQHTSLVASVFSPAYKVPDILVAETPALRKKTNLIRGTAGVRRKKLIKEIAMQRSATKSKLTYMDPPLSPRRPEPAELLPANLKEFVVPEAAMPSDDEVLVVVLSPWPLLTDCEQDMRAFAVARPPLPSIPRKKCVATDLSQASQPPSQPSQPPSQPSQSARTTRASSQGSSQVRAVGSCHARPKMTS